MEIIELFLGYKEPPLYKDGFNKCNHYYAILETTKLQDIYIIQTISFIPDNLFENSYCSYELESFIDIDLTNARYNKQLVLDIFMKKKIDHIIKLVYKNDRYILL